MAKFKLDPGHSSAKFSVKHMMIAKVHGGFETLEGELEFDPASPKAARLDVRIDAASIQTGDAKRDEHLRSADFFDVTAHPRLTFTSTKVDGVDGDLRVSGDLSIHGVTRSVVLLVEGPSEELKDPWGQTKIGASATTKIKRKDFGLNWNAALEAGGVLVGDEISITLDVQFIKVA